MRKSFIPIAFAALVALSPVCSAAPDAGECPSESAYVSAATNEVVRVDYYYGTGCSFCEKLAPWLADFEKKHAKDVDLIKHDIVLNLKDYEDFAEKMTRFDVKSDDQGTPTVVVNKKVLIGYDVIMESLDGEVSAAKIAMAEKANKAVDAAKGSAADE